MTRSEGMALAPWGVLGGGAFRTSLTREKAKQGGRKSTPTESQIKISNALEQIAARKGASVSLHSVALAYVMHKCPYVFPIIGCRTLEQLNENIEGLSVELTRDEIGEIENAAPFELGWPHDMFLSKSPKDVSGVQQITDNWGNAMFGTFVDVSLQQAIKPAEVKSLLKEAKLEQ
jgi:diketogulonate reductase-like aldo/keto reductase